MTAPTPKQIRELADIADSLNRDNEWDNEVIADVMVALRTAAGQLEAVREWADSSDREPNWDALDAILAADDSPQDVS